MPANRIVSWKKHVHRSDAVAALCRRHGCPDSARHRIRNDELLTVLFSVVLCRVAHLLSSLPGFLVPETSTSGLGLFLSFSFLFFGIFVSTLARYELSVQQTLVPCLSLRRDFALASG